MSFRGELLGFAKGLQAGSQMGSRYIDARYRNQQLKNISPATDANLAGQSSPYGSGASVGTASPTTDATHTSSTSSGGHALTGGPGGQTPGKPNDIYSGFMTGVKTVVNNPYALAAIAATGKSESGWSPGNVGRTWGDPSQSGQAGTSGGLMSWRAERLQALKDFAAKRGQDGLGDATTQGLFFAQENPQLIAALNNAKSPQEAADLMASAWRFAGYDNPNTGEAARRRSLAQNYWAQEYKDYTPQAAGTPLPATPKPKGVLPDDEDKSASADEEGDSGQEIATADPITVGTVSDPGIQTPQVALAFPDDQRQLYAARGGVIPEFDNGGGIDDVFTNYGATTNTAGNAMASANADNSGVFNVDNQGQDNWNVFHSGSGANTQGFGGSGFDQPMNIFAMPQGNSDVPPAPAPAPEPVIPDTGTVVQTDPAPVVETPVTTPAATTTTTTTTPTPSQTAFANANKKPAAPKNTPRPKTTKKAKKEDPDAALREQYLRTKTGLSWGQFKRRYGKSGNAGASNSQRSSGSSYGSRGYAGGAGLYEEGGIIPEYANGGTVSFEELLRQEKGDRDRAAKRYNAQKGGPVSSAYDPDGYWTKKDPAKFPARPKTPPQRGRQGLPSKAPIPTPRPKPDDQTSSVIPDETEVIEDRATRDRSVQRYPYPAEPGRIPAPASVPAPNTTTAPPQRPSVSSVEPSPEVSVGAAMDPAATGVPTGPDEGPVLPDDRSLAPPVPDRGAPTRKPDQTNAIRVPGDPNAVLPDRYAPATPPVPQVGGAWINGMWVSPNGDPPPPPEQGAWINGQWVPAATTAAPGAGFAEGGVVPEDDEPVMQSQHQPNYLTSRSAEASGNAQPASPQEERQYAQVSPTPKLIGAVSQAVSGGIDFINRIFGGGGDGAIPTDEGNRDGAMRMARGEGSATPEEIRLIDDRIDPDRQLSEGDRQMTRLAKTVSWYLEQGRKDDAEAAAASLLMYGAGRTEKLGAMAAAAYKSGDMEATVKFIEKAYETIPDASSLDIQVSPDGQGLVMNRTDAEGNSEQVPVEPGQLPQLLRTIQDKSMYWRNIERLSDPEGFRAEQVTKRQEEQDIRKRGYDLEDDKREQERKLAEAKVEDDQFYKHEKYKEDLYRGRPDKDKSTEKERSAADKARIRPWQTKLGQLGEEPEDEEEKAAWQEKRNYIISRIADALPDPKEEGTWLRDNLNVDADTWSYVPEGDDPTATTPAPAGAGTPTAAAVDPGKIPANAYRDQNNPPNVPGAKWDAKNGIWWQPRPGGGWQVTTRG